MTRTLFLIDAYAHLFRSYFAIRTAMRSPVTGEPTNAIFGFVAMLLRLLAQHPDALFLVAFDAPGRTFRDDLYPDYKATRAAFPEDLLPQISRIAPILDTIGISHRAIVGLEADDIIASITHAVLTDERPESAAIVIRILSHDKDLEQLICDRIGILDVSTNVVFDAAALFAKKGILPEQVTDYLTMTGDAVDNVPGIDRIGPKTAARYLQQYGSLDGIYANLDSLSTSHRDTFHAARDQAALSRTLVTLKRDALPEFRWEHAHRRVIDSVAATALFEELGFHRFQEAIQKLPVPALLP